MSSTAVPEISVVIPVCNEQENVGPLAQEIASALAGKQFEVLFVDDGSTDNTAAVVQATRAAIPQIRLLRHSFRSGQSAAVTTGVRHARAEWVGTLDGDGQNDPAFIPAMIDKLAAGSPLIGLIAGQRVGRKASGFKQFQSRIANGVRSSMLGDGTPDTGCGIKLLHRPTYLELPKFDHMHRFLPALFQRAGARVISVPVNHRPRMRGTSKYGMLNRLWVGIVDIFGVMWLRRRFKSGLPVREE